MSQGTIKVAIAVITITITILSVYSYNPSFLSMWIGLIVGCFLSLGIIFILEKIFPSLSINLKPLQVVKDDDETAFVDDIDVILSFGKSLESLSKDRLPKESDLEYSIKTIENSINRLKVNDAVPEKYKLILKSCEPFLLLYKMKNKTK